MSRFDLYISVPSSVKRITNPACILDGLQSPVMCFDAVAEGAMMAV
jgi:hypothetical protein